VVIYNFDVFRAIVRPHETNTELVVNPYAVQNKKHQQKPRQEKPKQQADINDLQRAFMKNRT
jgi:hypothetical protein